MDQAEKRKPYIALSVKLVTWVFFFSVLFTVLMTAILIGMRYGEERKHAHEQLEFAASSYNKSLANSLWEMDMVGTRLQLEALSHFPMVGHVVLTTGVGQQFHLHHGREESSAKVPANALFWRENLTSPAQSDRLVGQLWLYVDEEALVSRLQGDALRILVAEALKGLVLGMLVIWLVNHLITRHLAKMANDTANRLPSASASDQSLRLDRKSMRSRDELDLLCEAFNKLHQDLEQYHKQRQLEAHKQAQDKLAALSALVAGVAHEMNTPLGNSLIMASALQDKTHELAEKVRQKQLRQSDLLHFLQEAEDGCKLLVSGLTKSANMVQSFKQVAVDRSSAQAKEFDLSQVCHEVVATTIGMVKQKKHTISVEVEEGIYMNSYPLPLSQVLLALIENALVHAFPGREGGQMYLCARRKSEQQIVIEFIDNGIGIAPEHLERVFEPFFTTRMGQGSNGLGLHICYNIITTLMHGEIGVRSRPGQGSCFVLTMPLDSEQAAPQ